jgi:hypothetical protein
MTTRTWISAHGLYGTASAWQPSGVPQPGDVLVIQSGSVTLKHGVLAGVVVELTGLESAPPTLVFSGVTIAATTTIDASNFVYNASNYNYSGVIDASGSEVNFGTLGAASTDFESAARLTLNVGGAFTNAGTIESNAMGFVTVEASAPGAAFANDGLIDIFGHGTLAMAVGGAGTMRLEAAAPEHSFIATPQLTVAAVGSGQTLAFLGGDDLRLTDLADFHGAISGFSAVPAFGQPDRIDLIGQAITATEYAANATGGVLTLLAGRTAEGQIRFSGSYAASDFVLTQGQALTASGAVVPDTALTLA